MTTNPEETIPLATPETSATQNKREGFEVQVAAVFRFGVPAVILLVVAGVIYDSNKKNYWKCYNEGLGGDINTNGCAGGGPYACVAPRLPTPLVWIATACALLSSVAGIRSTCSEWWSKILVEPRPSTGAVEVQQRSFWSEGLGGATCCGSTRKSCHLSWPSCIIASCFFILELLALAYYAFTLLAFSITSDYVNQAPLSTLGTGLSILGTGRCCCDFWDTGDGGIESPLIMAGIAAAITFFGAGHLLARKQEGEKQGGSAWLAM